MQEEIASKLQERRMNRMKTLKLIVLISILFLIPTYSHGSPLGSLRISQIDGDVQIRTEDTGDWVPASINMPLRDGDQIWVPEGGRTELELIDGTYLRLDQESALEILTVERDSFQFYLTEGHLYAGFRGLKGSLLQIDTSLSSVRTYDPSNFRIDIQRTGRTDISVYRGFVYTENGDGRTRVEEGETLAIAQGHYAELLPIGPADEWERWNLARDRRLADARPPSRYLPEELQAYSRDFEENGRWEHVPEYGYVWRPRVVVSAGWAPYQVGRWVWAADDFVWISYEPWGWAPYHYGRWAFVVSVGWCWVPPLPGAVYWGPGFVGWVQTPTYIAWVPLAPGEMYYGHGYYGPHSVNVTNVNVTNIHIEKTVYKNVHVHNAVTVVHHDTFVNGKHGDGKVTENPFNGRAIHAGRPDIKPEKTTVMPVVREIPRGQRPPESIREVHVTELKQRRPLVKEKDSSVLRPNGVPKKMPVNVIEKKVGEGSKESNGAEKQIERRQIVPSQGQEPSKPFVAKTPENGLGRPKKPLLPAMDLKELKPVARGNGTPQETKPSQKIVAKSGETRLPENGPVEKLKVYKSANRTSGPSQETKVPNSKVMRPTQSRLPDREIVKSTVSVPLARSQGQFAQTERRPAENTRAFPPSVKTVKQPQESKPTVKAAERSTLVERSNLKSAKSLPQVRGTAKPGYLIPQQRVQKSGING